MKIDGFPPPFSFWRSKKKTAVEQSKEKALSASLSAAPAIDETSLRPPVGHDDPGVPFPRPPRGVGADDLGGPNPRPS